MTHEVVSDQRPAHVGEPPAEPQTIKYLFPTLPELFPQVQLGEKLPPGLRRQIIWTEVLRPDESGLTFHHDSISGKSTVRAVYFERTDPNTSSLGGSLYLSTKGNEELTLITRGAKASDSVAKELQILRALYSPFYDATSDRTLAQLIRREIAFPRIDGRDEVYIRPKREKPKPPRRPSRIPAEAPTVKVSEAPISGDLIERVELDVPPPTPPKEVKPAPVQLDPAERTARVAGMVADILRNGRRETSRTRPKDRADQTPTSIKSASNSSTEPTQIPEWAVDATRGRQRLDDLEIRILMAKMSRKKDGDLRVISRSDLIRTLFGPDFSNLPEAKREQIEAGIDAASITLTEKMAILLEPSNQSPYALEFKRLIGNRPHSDVMSEVTRRIPRRF